MMNLHDYQNSTLGGDLGPMELHDYQRVAVEHLRTHPRAGLFLDMGLRR